MATILVGERFDHLEVVEEADPWIRVCKDKTRTDKRWKVKCDCGTEKVVLAMNLKGARIKSCGCGQWKHSYKRGLEHPSAKHGMWGTPAYESWNSMKDRCNNPNASNYDRYGGRGIAVCAPWNDFVNFFADMGERPDGKTLDRIDNDGNYEPSNCRWATAREQQLNKG